MLTRTEFATCLARSAQQAHKTVSTIDIARDPAYMALFGSPSVLLPRLGLLGAVGTCTAAIGHKLMSPEAQLSQYAPAFFASIGAAVAGKLYDRATGGSLRDDPNITERLLPSYEDARRVYMARGLELLSLQYPRSTLYYPQPRAHHDRLIEYLLDRRPEVRLKGPIYSAMTAPLRPSVNLWRHVYDTSAAQDTSAGLGYLFPDTRALAGWQRVSNQPI